MSELRFHEVQRFRQGWLWAIVGALAIGAWGWFLTQAVVGIQVGPKPAPTTLLAALAAVLGVALPLWFWRLSMETTVDSREVRVRYWPLAEVRIALEKIAEAESVTYRPIGEYGGWGVRSGWGRGWCYNVTGNRGVRLKRSDGSLLLIGSQRADELAAAILKTEA
jgi:hypothetical protein